MHELPLISFRQTEAEVPARAALFFPPGWDSDEAPPAGLAYLAGYTGARGHHPEIVDLNHDYLHSLVMQDTELKSARDRNREKLAAMDSGRQLTDPISYAETAMLATAPYQAGRLALDGFRRFMQKEESEHGLVVGKRYDQIQLGEPGRPQFRGRIDRCMAILRKLDTAVLLGLIGDEELGPGAGLPAIMDHAAHIEDSGSYYDRLISDRVIPYLSETQPQLAGISINTDGQIIPAVRLAARIRRAFPGMRILLGGNQTHHKKHLFVQTPWLGKIVDGIVFNEGEGALTMCLNTIDEPDKWAGFPNIGVYNDGALQLPRTQKRTQPEVVPDYGVLTTLLDEPRPYASRRLELVATRGCYRPKCLFCNHFTDKTGPEWVPTDFRKPETGFVQRMLESLSSQGMDTFYFVDEALPPNMLKEIAQGILNSGIKIQWGAYARFERPFERPELAQLLRDSGLRFLEMGLESASQRVLDAMDKGIRIDATRKGLDNLLAAGIRPYVFIMFGFPTETEEEAQQTLDFMREYTPKGARFGSEIFHLVPDALAIKRREELGVELLVPEEELVADHFGLVEGVHWRRTRGISAERAGEIWQEAQSIKRGSYDYPRLEGHSKLVLNGFAGTVPVAHSNALREEFINDTTIGLRTDSDFMLGIGESGCGTEVSLIQILQESHLASAEAVALVNEFSKPVPMQRALEAYCAKQGLGPSGLNDRLRQVISAMVERGVLVIVPEEQALVSGDT